MDGQRFDELTRTLASGATRRRVLRGLVGGMAAALGLRAVGVRAGQAKQPLCHFTGNPENPYEVIEVAEPAWDTHFGHGDHPFIDCCLDADCLAAGETCGGDGVVGACGCTPDNTAACLGQNCGTATNNCGQTVSCGTCTPPETCGGGGTSNVCGCTSDPLATTCEGQCGTVTNNCGQAVQCPACCTPTTCAAVGATCGNLSDGCGATLDCGTCPEGTVCGDNGCGGVGISCLLPVGATCTDACHCATGECEGTCCVGTIGECESDGDCCADFACDAGSCEPICAYDYCESDADCCAGLSCDAKMCQP